LDVRAELLLRGYQLLAVAVMLELLTLMLLGYYCSSACLMSCGSSRTPVLGLDICTAQTNGPVTLPAG
jgi:hypothetical protein